MGASPRAMLAVWPIAAVALAACAAGDSVWGLATVEARERVAAGDYAWITPARVARAPGRVRWLGEDAGYYVGVALQADGHRRAAMALWRYQTQVGSASVRHASRIALAEALLATGAWRDALRTARAHDGDATTPNGARLARVEIAALFSGRRYREVAAALPAPVDAEGAYMSMVSTHQSGRGGASDTARSLSLLPTAHAHRRAAQYLRRSEAPVTPEVRLLIDAKSAIAAGSLQPAIDHMESGLSAITDGADAPLVAELVALLAATYRSALEAHRGYRFLIGLRAPLGRSAEAALHEARGRLLRDLDRHREAIIHFDHAMSTVPAGDRAAADRMLWLRTDSQRRSGTLPGLIIDTAALWSDPAFFNDLLADELAKLVRQRKWSELLRYQRLATAYADPMIAARAGFIVARAAQHGLLQASEQEAVALFQEVRRLDRGGYFGMLAGLASAEPVEIVAGAAADLRGDQDRERLVLGFLDYGLTDRVLAAATEHWSGLGALTLVSIAGELARRGYVSAAVRLASRSVFLGPAGATPAALRLTYPRPFDAEIESLRPVDLDRRVLFALIREESLFDPSAVSSAGATGLMQLMPVTAGDVAARLDISSYDLRNPVQNLTFGITHLARLLELLDGRMYKALLAYNAGLSRVRAWDRSFGDLPPELYVEAVPFAESRDYVRKIARSTVRYDHLYGTRSPQKAIEAILTEIHLP